MKLSTFPSHEAPAAIGSAGPIWQTAAINKPGGYENENIHRCCDFGIFDRDHRQLVFFKRVCCARRIDEWARQHLRIEQGQNLR
jgi:hypothetical protein